MRRCIEGGKGNFARGRPGKICEPREEAHEISEEEAWERFADQAKKVRKDLRTRRESCESSVKTLLGRIPTRLSKGWERAFEERPKGICEPRKAKNCKNPNPKVGYTLYSDRSKETGGKGVREIV